jgi:drug/metabolite transporter (DMT)-like permease
MDSRWLVPIRLGLAGVILLVYCLIRFGRYTFQPLKNLEDRKQLLVYGLAGISLCQFLYFTTIQYSTAGAATILQDLSPVMILFVECHLAKRKPRVTEIISVILALIGIYLITTHGTGKLSIRPLALVTGVLCAVCVTIYNCYPRKLLAHYPVILLQGWAFLMGGLLFAFVFRIWEYDYTPTLMGLFGIAFVVVVGNILAFSMYMEGVKLIGPGRGILYGFAEPVTAALVSFFLLGTPFTLGDLFGFVCIFGMLVMISVNQKEK